MFSCHFLNTGLGKFWRNLNVILQKIYNGSQWVVDREQAAEPDVVMSNALDMKACETLYRAEWPLTFGFKLKKKKKSVKCRSCHLHALLLFLRLLYLISSSVHFEKAWLYDCSAVAWLPKEKFYLTSKKPADHWCETTSGGAVRKHMLAWAHDTSKRYMNILFCFFGAQWNLVMCELTSRETKWKITFCAIL